MVKCYAMRHGGGKEKLHRFSTFALNEGKWLDSHSSHFTPGKEAYYPMDRGPEPTWTVTNP
jgi:hypothetical protein